MRRNIPLILIGIPAIAAAQETVQFDFPVIPSLEQEFAELFFLALFLLALWKGLTKLTDLTVEHFPWKTFRYSVPVLAVWANLSDGNLLSIFYSTWICAIWWMAWQLLEYRGWSKQMVRLEWE